MSRIIKFDRRLLTPIVSVVVYGSRDRAVVRLVFDTGAAFTELHTAIAEDIGYSARDGIERVTAFGPAGPMQEGYTLELKRLTVFGLNFEGIKVAVYDFDNLTEMKVDGLLGWDLIKEMRLELDGPAGELRVFAQ